MRRRGSQSGFTLLEVLLAAVLLGSVFVAVVSVMSHSLRNIDRMTPHEIAMRHAREVMTEELVREQLEVEHSIGRWDDGFRWDVEIQPYELITLTPNTAPALPQLAISKPGAQLPQAGASGLFQIRVRVLWGDEQQPRSYEIVTTQWAKVPLPKAS